MSLIFDPAKLDMFALSYADKDSDRLDIIMDAMVSGCGCGHCGQHDSDCAVHNGDHASVCDCRLRVEVARGEGR